MASGANAVAQSARLRGGVCYLEILYSWPEDQEPRLNPRMMCFSEFRTVCCVCIFVLGENDLSVVGKFVTENDNG